MKILDKVNEVIAENTGCKDATPESELKVDVGLDSLSLVSVIVGLEEKFGIVFDDGDLDPSKIRCVRDLVELVEKML